MDFNQLPLRQKRFVLYELQFDHSRIRVRTFHDAGGLPMAADMHQLRHEIEARLGAIAEAHLIGKEWTLTSFHLQFVPDESLLVK